MGGIAHGISPALAVSSQVERIDIAVRRIERFSRAMPEASDARFGRLRFNGGLVLTSPSKDFGGLSGLVIADDGQRFVAVSDAGSWLTGRLTYDEGRPSGVADVHLGPILALGGKGLGRKRDVDAEAVCLAEGNLDKGTLLIAFERNHRIGRFPIVGAQVQAPTSYLRLPAETRQMSRNKGFEALCLLAGGPLKGSVVAISERFPNADGHHTGWVWWRGEPQRFGVKDEGGYDITDVASLADGSLIVLERRFRWFEGVKMQLRLMPAEAIAPDRMIAGEVLLTAGLGSEIDNMEGLAVHRDAKTGETVLTLVSDDNFNSFLQRTILLQFALMA